MIIFLHGDDTYRSREKLRELTGRFLREVDPSGANLVVMDGTTASASDIWAAIAAQSFLVRKRMVVVERIGEPRSMAVRTELAALLARVPEDVILVFWESKSRQKTGESRQKTEDRRQKNVKAMKARGKKTPSSSEKDDPLFPLLLAEKYAQEFMPLVGAELATWVRARVAERDATIAPDALRALTAEVGSDLWRMHTEIEKLAAAALGDPTPSR
ncbi:hypothetical protein HY480_02125, partial [Candidatus Uhrbacteria bacterium]|nr:hypothetical protein [Candidatus Uhrbacteria bacterium]